MEKTHRISLLAAVVAAAMLTSACSDDVPPPPTDGPAGEAQELEHRHHDHDHAEMPRTPAPDDARVFFIEPDDGATLSSPVTVVFGLEGMEVVPAGVERDNAGHHHLLINVETLPDMNAPLPATDQVVHFGTGQTEAEIELPAGTHTLQLLLGDHLHRPHDPPVFSEQITITVE